MLVLKRAVNEEILIGDNIRLMVVEVRNGFVRIGIDAPKDITVHRKEVADAIRREGDAARQREVDSEQYPGIGEDYA